MMALPNSPSSRQRWVQRRWPTSHTYTSELSARESSWFSVFGDVDHHSDLTLTFILRLATTWPAPEFQSTRWVLLERPATARMVSVGLQTQVDMVRSWVERLERLKVVPQRPRGERWVVPDWRLWV
jgi:hypothetical protein